MLSFLYIKNWHTGEKQISRPRVVLFMAGLFLIGLALAVSVFLPASTY